jgi:hypothetical protein
VTNCSVLSAARHAEQQGFCALERNFVAAELVLTPYCEYEPHRCVHAYNLDVNIDNIDR